MRGYYDYYDYYDYAPIESALEGVAGFLVGFVLIFALIALLFCVVVYVLESLSLYTIAKRRGIHNPWLSWLPIGNVWIIGCISDQYRYVAKGTVTNRRKILLGFAIAFAILSVLTSFTSFVTGLSAGMGDSTGIGLLVAVQLLIAFVSFVLSIVHLVFFYIALNDIYGSCDPSNHTVYLVLSILFSVTIPVFLMICRNKDGGMPPRKPVQPEAEFTPHPAPVALEPIFEEVPAELVTEEEEKNDLDVITESDFEPQ